MPTVYNNLLSSAHGGNVSVSNSEVFGLNNATRTVQGMTSLHDANIATSLPTINNAIHANILPSVGYTTNANNLPSVLLGGGMAATNARQHNPSKNSNTARMNSGLGMTSKSFDQLFTTLNPGGHNLSISSPIPIPVISEKLVETHRGEPCITFEDNEVQQMNKIENIMLVGKFSHGEPLLSEIRSFFAKTFVLRGTVEIGLMDPRHVFLAFSNPDDCVDIFVKGQISFNGKYLMRLFQWTADFDTRFETSLLRHLWPLFLHVDAATTKFSRRNVAKVKVGDGVGTSSNPLLGSQPVAPIPISTCNTFTLLQDVNEIVLAEGAHTQEDVRDTTIANHAHTQEATNKDFDVDLDDHLAKGDASSAAPTSLGLQTPVREQGTGLCLLNTEQATIPTVSPVAQHTKAPVARRTRRTRSASEQSNVAGFYREASDDDSNSSVAGRVATFESAGHHREFAGAQDSPPKTSQVPFGGRITRSQGIASHGWIPLDYGLALTLLLLG
nr:hypothetical protein DM860_018267 [Ipomoea trifida]